MSALYRVKDEKSSSVKGAVGSPSTQQQQQSIRGGDLEVIERIKSLEVEIQEMSIRVSMLEKNREELVATLQKYEEMHAKSTQENGDDDDDDDDDDDEDDDEDDEDDEDDDEIDLFGDDAGAKKHETTEQKVVETRSAKKPAFVAKSTILFDVKPWDDETDMVEVERCVRSVEAEGLLWGASKLVDVGYGIKKLQIGCVVEDEKVSTDMLEEEITKFEDVQSVDIASFNKL